VFLLKPKFSIWGGTLGCLFCILVIVYEKARFGERAKGFENFAALYAVVALKGLARLHKEKNPPQPKKTLDGPKIGPLDI
jgi:hypothetical protein